MDFIKSDRRVHIEENGKVVAEITFPLIKEGVVNFDRTFVDSSLRGQGIAEKLLLEALDIVSTNNQKVTSTCSYVTNWFEKHPDYAEKFLTKD